MAVKEFQTPAKSEPIGDLASISISQLTENERLSLNRAEIVRRTRCPLFGHLEDSLGDRGHRLATDVVFDRVEGIPAVESVGEESYLEIREDVVIGAELT